MGDYRITVDAVGGHGCQRGVGDGQKVEADCGQPHCPDCAARRFVTELRQSNSVTAATLEHWPKKQHGGHERESGVGPIDDLVTLERKGAF